MNAASPVEHPYDLSRLSDAGDDVVVRARPEQLLRLAQWLEIESVQKFEAAVTLSKLAAHRYRYDGILTCDLTQSSVVSLDPVQTRIRERFSRELHVAPRARRPQAQKSEPVIADGDDDVPEELDSPQYDLAAPLLEELSLALNPYPRAPGEDFNAPEDLGERRESPFAILKKLKDGG